MRSVVRGLGWLFTLTLLRLTYNLFGKPGMGRGMGFFLLAGFMGYQALLLTGSL